MEEMRGTKIEPGTVLIVPGYEKIVVRKILEQHYLDGYGYDLEFDDIHGKYRHWVQWLDHGSAYAPGTIPTDQETGRMAAGLYSEYMEMYAECDGLGHFDECGMAFLTLIHPEKIGTGETVPVLYIVYDNEYMRIAPDLFQEFFGVTLDCSKW